MEVPCCDLGSGSVSGCPGDAAGSGRVRAAEGRLSLPQGPCAPRGAGLSPGPGRAAPEPQSRALEQTIVKPAGLQSPAPPCGPRSRGSAAAGGAGAHLLLARERCRQREQEIPQGKELRRAQQRSELAGSGSRCWGCEESVSAQRPLHPVLPCSPHPLIRTENSHSFLTEMSQMKFETSDLFSLGSR